MEGITTYRKKVFEKGLPGDEYAMLQVTLDIPEACGREKQKLAEEKIDRLFGEVGKLLVNASDHTA